MAHVTIIEWPKLVRQIGRATTSTTSVIKEGMIGCTIKQAPSSIKDKAREAHVVAHVDGHYDAVNV